MAFKTIKLYSDIGMTGSTEMLRVFVGYRLGVFSIDSMASYTFLETEFITTYALAQCIVALMLQQ